MEIKAAKRGGARPGAGRKRGVRDKATGEERASLEELARTHTEAALATLHRVCTTSTSDAAATSAAIAILDRGYGKPRQAVEVAGDPNNPVNLVTRIERHIVDPENSNAKGIPSSPAKEKV